MSVNDGVLVSPILSPLQERVVALAAVGAAPDDAQRTLDRALTAIAFFGRTVAHQRVAGFGQEEFLIGVIEHPHDEIGLGEHLVERLLGRHVVAFLIKKFFELFHQAQR